MITQYRLGESGFERSPIKTRQQVFLEQMEQVVPWSELVELIRPHAPTGGGAKGGRLVFAVETMSRFRHLLERHGIGQRILRKINELLVQTLPLLSGLDLKLKGICF